MASTEASTVVLYSQGHAWRQQRQVPSYCTARSTHGVNRGKYHTVQPGPRMASTRQVPYCTARATHGVNRGKYRTVQPGPRMVSTEVSTVLYSQGHAWRQQRQIPAYKEGLEEVHVTAKEKAKIRFCFPQIVFN